MRLGRVGAIWLAAVTTVAVSVIGTEPGAAATAAPVGTITVSAASSLTDVFPVIAAAFEKRFPGTTVRFNFGGSSALVEQVNAGAPVDVLATASEPTMWKAVNAGHAGRPLLFAKNTMAIAMPPGNSAGVTSLSDLSRTDVITAACAVAVPCGSAARDLFARNGVTVRPVTFELDVRGVLGKVMADEVDAGIVYVTDVRAAGSAVTSVAIPADRNVTTTYPIAAVISSANPVTAKAFVAYVRYSRSAQGILRAYGFARPW
ncbi:MAG: molybdate ABC transporter substrate-binding protein [Actinobacteria bacterium]|nr:molybdate ABC transporter substrate-binding protein [Actinomycetota bacterium]